MTESFENGDRVRVVKARVASDEIVGKTGTILSSTNDLKLFWIVCIDGKTYTEGEEGDLLHTHELELIGRKVEFGQSETCLSNISFHSGWSYSVRYTLKPQLSYWRILSIICLTTIRA